MRIKTYFLELQYRLFFIFFNIFSITILSYCYKKEILYIGSYYKKELLPYFISTHLTEIFSVYLKVSLFLGFYFSFPFFILQLGIFLSPALYKYEKKILIRYITLILFLFIVGLNFAYTFFIPYCWKFFSSFQSSLNEETLAIHFETKLNPYCNFFLESMLGIQFFFQVLGGLLFFIPKLKPKFYTYSRKLIYFIFLVLATLVTPPDILSQICMAIILIFAYENFVFFFLLIKEYQRANNGT